jgi:hypothetical protein
MEGTYNYINSTGTASYLPPLPLVVRALSVSINNGVAIADLSSVLDITSTTKGFLPPRMTEAQKLAISTPAVGLMIYQTDGTEGLYIYASIGWLPVGGTASSVGSATTLFNYFNFT